ncbi:MAG: hypothetical protein EXR27_11430 [Betaproteobacteria bacterium]|nr:hypothetical protein [Betaproteobacteria bacterium]
MKTTVAVKVADEVWIAIALLHREQPKRRDFPVQEIVDRAARERVHASLRPGVSVHAYQHCVANLAPNPGRYRMLAATGKNTRRIFHPDDEYHPDREGGKVCPKREEIPEEYWPLLDWYEARFGKTFKKNLPTDPVLAMKGMWKGLWKDEKPDAYVRRLREWG